MASSVQSWLLCQFVIQSCINEDSSEMHKNDNPFTSPQKKTLNLFIYSKLFHYAHHAYSSPHSKGFNSYLFSGLILFYPWSIQIHFRSIYCRKVLFSLCYSLLFVSNLLGYSMSALVLHRIYSFFILQFLISECNLFKSSFWYEKRNDIVLLKHKSVSEIKIKYQSDYLLQKKCWNQVV